jgi:hypothetical protein
LAKAIYALALARLAAGFHLVDDVNPALAADNAAIAVSFLERFQRVYDFHVIAL